MAKRSKQEDDGQVDRCLYDEDEIRSQIASYEAFLDKAASLLPKKPTAEERSAVQATLVKIEEVEAELELLRARISFDDFAESVMRDDESGRPIKQSPIHRKWTKHCEQEDRLIIWSHRNSGKTTQISVARTVWELGRDPTLRFLILSNTAEIAVRIVKSIAGLIKDNAMVQKIFPHLKPNPDGPWTNTQLQVVRDSNSPSPSVRAAGVHGSVTGMRIDRAIIDDILDFENTLTDKERKKTMAWYKATVPGCLTRRARVIIVGTAYHPKDFIHEMSSVRGYKWFRFPLISDTGQITWPELWSEKRIQDLRDELGPAEFARQAQCRARDDDEARFKQEWIDIALNRGRGIPLITSLDELVMPDDFPEGTQVQVFTGVDLSTGKKKKKTDRTSFFTLIQYPNGDRQLALIDSGKFTGPEIIAKIENTQTNFGGVIAVEDNGAQSYILQFAAAGSNVPVVPHTTGKAKRDPILGVESLAIELANGKWIFPCAEDGRRVHPEVAAFIEEMLFFDPKAHTGDRLMSAYFAREVARRYAGEAKFIPGVAMRVIGESAPSPEQPTEVYRSGPNLKKLFDVPDAP